MAVVEDNSLKFALQEIAGFSLSGKSVHLKPEPVAASTEKIFWRFYQLVSAKVFVRVKKFESVRSKVFVGLYRYVRPQRVWFFSRFGHKLGIDFSHFAAILVINRVSIFAL